MVAVPGILSRIPRASTQGLPLASFDAASRLNKLLAEIDELVIPLASARTRAELLRLVERIAPNYLHLRNEVARLFQGASSEAAVRWNEASRKEVSILVEKDTVVLGPDERDILVDVLDRDRDMVQALVAGFEADPVATYDLVLECASALVSLNMCLWTIHLVLDEKATQWNPTSIRLLAHLAHEAQTRVEDHFLLHDRELAERLATRGPTVGLAEVKRRVGLQS